MQSELNMIQPLRSGQLVVELAVSSPQYLHWSQFGNIVCTLIGKTFSLNYLTNT